MMRIRSTVAGLFLFVFILTAITPSFAQNIQASGEIRTSGNVLIAASNGQWMPAMKTYPILPNTGIRTEDGTAALFLKDGSRLDINKQSTSTFNSTEPSVYAVNLAQGTIAFNMKPTAVLTITTPTTTVSVNGSGHATAQKVSSEKAGSIIGAVTVTDKGTEVRSISGRIIASNSGGEAKVVGTGESAFVGPDSKVKIYTAQSPQAAVTQEEERRRAAALLQQGGTQGTNYVPAYVIGGLMVGGITAITIDGARGHSHHNATTSTASPSSFKFP